MSLELAIYISEVMLALAVIQQSVEHLRDGQDRALFAARIAFSLILLSGLPAGAALIGLFATAVIYLHRFAGPYNGGSDKMTILITFWPADRRACAVAIGCRAGHGLSRGAAGAVLFRVGLCEDRET